MNGEGTIYIGMPMNVSTGARAISEDVFAYISINGKAYSTLFGAPNGTVTITKRTDEIMEGTFNFVAYDADDFETEMKVENGSFKVKFRDF